MNSLNFAQLPRFALALFWAFNVACGDSGPSDGLFDAGFVDAESVSDASSAQDATVFDGGADPDGGSTPTRLEQIEGLIAPFVAEGWFPGLSGAFIDGDDIQFLNFGATALNGDPPDEFTLYEIGSITKTLTGLLLAQMHLSNEVAITDPVQNYLPQTVTMPSWPGKPILLEYLSTHHSSLPSFPNNMPSADPLDPFADYTVDLLYEYLNGYTLLRSPDTTFEYSNLAVGLLGHVLARTASTSYEPLLRERILEPLGLLDTAIALTSEQGSRLAPAYDADLTPISSWQLGPFESAGALRSSAQDMVTYAQSIIAPTSLSDEIALATAPRKTVNPQIEIGLGWFSTEGGDVVFHEGATGGYRAFLLIVPSERRAVYLAINSATYVLSELGLALVSLLRIGVLPAVSARPVVEVSEQILDELAGTYALGNTVLAITKQGGVLYGQITGQPQFRTYAESDARFYLRVVDVTLVFQRDASDQVTGVSLLQNGQSYLFLRQ